MVFLTVLSTNPPEEALGARLPKRATQEITCTHLVCPSRCPWEAEMLQPLSLQCLQAKLDTRQTFIYFNYLILKPEVGTRPRKGLNGLATAKSFSLSCVSSRSTSAPNWTVQPSPTSPTVPGWSESRETPLSEAGVLSLNWGALGDFG